MSLAADKLGKFPDRDPNSTYEYGIISGNGLADALSKILNDVRLLIYLSIVSFSYNRIIDKIFFFGQVQKEWQFAFLFW